MTLRTADIGEVRRYWDRQPCGVLRPPDNRYRVQPHIPAFADFPRWNDRRVLEIGCGIGVDAWEFAKAGAWVDAIDLSDASLQIAMERCYTYNRRVAFWNLDAELPLPPPIHDYDLVYSFGVIHHTPHPECVLQNARRVLNHDGELRIMLYAKWSLKRLLLQQPEAQTGCPIVRWYSARQARWLIEDAGFRVTSIEKTHIFPWRVADYVEGRYVKGWPWRVCPEWLFRWLERRLGHHLLIKAVKR